MDWILGIDEVRKSPVLGSLIIAGFAVPANYPRYLRVMGVKDSKEIYPKTLKKMDKALRRNFPHKICKIKGSEISKAGNLNDLEAKYFAKIIKHFSNQNYFDSACPIYLDLNAVYIDCVDITAEKFMLRLSQYFPVHKIDSRFVFEGGRKDALLIIEHDADKKYAVVGAASIIAKAASDREMDRIRKKYACGSGEPKDKQTIQFLKKCIKENDIPDFVRTNWITFRRLQKPVQKKNGF